MTSVSTTIGVIAQQIRDRRCGLFLGAGFSALAGMPSSADLARRLKDVFCKVPDPRLEALIAKNGLTLELISDYVSKHLHDQYGSHKEVARIIGQAEKAADPAAFRKLAHLPFQYVITTNYDTLIEGSFPHFQPDAIVRHDDQASNIIGKRPLLAKINGDITHPEQMVLSSSDLREYTASHPRLVRLAASLFEAGPMLFLGFAKQNHAFVDLAKSYLNSLPPTTRPHQWYVVDHSGLAQELAALSTESTTVIETELDSFIDLLSLSFAEGRIPPGRSWSISGAVDHLSDTLGTIRARYESVSGTIEAYQDPGTRYMLAMVLNAELSLLIVEQNKLRFAADELGEGAVSPSERSDRIRTLLSEAADLYRPIEKKVRRDISNNVFQQFMPGNEHALDVAQLFEPTRFQKESRVAIKCFHPRYGQVPDEVIEREEDEYAKVIDLRKRNRQAEVFALYFLKKYIRLHDLQGPAGRAMSLRQAQRAIDISSEGELFEDCDRSDATVLALEQLEEHVQPLQTAFDSFGMNFALHGGTADTYIEEIRGNIKRVKDELDVLKAELNIAQDEEPE